MARIEEDREDLFGEATAYPQRGEFALSEDEHDMLFVGLKPGMKAAFYFGADPVYQFDGQGKLRRVYRHGALYRSQGTTLAQLLRERTAEQTTLVRHDLTQEELQTVLAEMRTQLQNIQQRLSDHKLPLLRCTIDADVFQKAVQNACQTILDQTDPLAPALK
ncbi:hypothetical protein GYB59_05285 [bacterium]|nr:hypothetical protein [bacterium]